MKKSLYRKALGHSWKLAWQHKELWIFGLFAAVLGQMGILELLSKVTFASKKYAALENLNPTPALKQIFFGLKDLPWNIESGLLFIWLLVMLVGLIIFGVFVSIVSQGAIIHSASQSVKKKTLPDTSKAWHAGVDHFWRLLSLNIAKKAVIMGLAFIVSIATINVLHTGGTWDVVVFFILFVLSMVIGLVISFLAVYAAGYVVVEEYSFTDSLKSAWRLFLDHWLVSIEVGLIIFAFNLVLILVLLAGLFTLLLHAVLLVGITVSTGILGIFNAGLFIEFIVFVGFIMFVASLFTVFSTTAWTYLFMKMHKHGIKSRIVHIFHGRKK